MKLTDEKLKAVKKGLQAKGATDFELQGVDPTSGCHYKDAVSFSFLYKGKRYACFHDNGAIKIAIEFDYSILDKLAQK